MYRLNLIAGLALVLLQWTLCTGPINAGNWPHFGYDDQYTSFSPAATRINPSNVGKLQFQWGLSCDDGYFFLVYGSPALYAGGVYGSGAGQQLTGMNASDGTILWQFGPNNSGWAPQPAISADGIIYYLLGANPTNLYAVTRSGTQIWKAPIAFDFGFQEATQAVPTIDEGKKIIYVVENPFASEGGKLYALSKASGKVLWYKSKAKDGMAFRGRYVLLKGSTIFADALIPGTSYWGDETLVRINPTTKKIEIKYARPSSSSELVIGRYSLCNDTLVVEYCDRDLIIPGYKKISIVATYNVNSPKIVWQKDFSKTPLTGAFACNTKTKRLYVPTNPYLYSFDVATGKQYWRYTGYDEIYSPSIANGVIFFTSETNMYALNEATGKKLFAYDYGYHDDSGTATTQVAIGDDMVYLSGSGGTCDFVALSLPTSESQTP